MKHRSKKERFYIDVGEAMSMNDMRCFINVETLEVEIHASEDFYGFEDDEMDDLDEGEDTNEREDTAKDIIENPNKFLAIGKIYPSQSFKLMQEFTEAVKDKNLQRKLFQALERKKPFANFKNVVDDSQVRQDWFEFRNEAYAELAKEWLNDNASEELKSKIYALPSVYIAE